MEKDRNYWEAVRLRLKFSEDRPDEPPDNPISEAFRDDYSAENYVKLRLGFPHQFIGVSSRTGYAWLISNRQRLDAFAISFEDVRGALDAEPDCMNRLSFRLLELLIARADREKAGETHLAGRGEAISDSLVSFLIMIMLDALDDHEPVEMPRDLSILIKHHIGAMSSIELKSKEVNDQRQLALDIGALYLKTGKPVSMSVVAKILKVERSTVLRWFEGADFQSEVRNWFEALERHHSGDWGPTLG